MLVACFAAALLHGPAWAQKVTTEFDESIDFSNFKTFLVREGRINSRDPALNSTLVEKRIRNLIADQLRAKGLSEVAEKPDLVARFALGAQNRQPKGPVVVGPRGRRTRPVATPYTAGTLTVDLLNAADRELLWRGIATDNQRDSAKIEQHLDSSVKKIFDKYPPKRK